MIREQLEDKEVLRNLIKETNQILEDAGESKEREKPKWKFSLEILTDLLEAKEADPASSTSTSTLERTLENLSKDMPEEFSQRISNILDGKVFSNENSVSENNISESRLMKVSTYTPATFLTEALKTNKEDGVFRARIVVIEQGESANGRFYPAETLEKAAPLFEDKSVHAFKFGEDDLNHLPEEIRNNIANQGPPLGNKVGALENCGYVGKNERIECDLVSPITESTNWFVDMAKGAIKLGKQFFGFSIDGEGEAHPVRRNGHIVDLVEKIESIFSVDAVSEPAAGGRILALISEAVGDPYGRLRSKYGSIPMTNANEDLGGSMSYKTAEAAVSEVARILENDLSLDARNISGSLQKSLWLDRANHDVAINVDKITSRLEAIPSPSTNVTRSLRILASAETQTREQEETEELEVETKDAVEIVEELVGLLEGEEDTEARAVIKILEDALEEHENGNDVTIDVEELHKSLSTIEDPSEGVMKAIELLDEQREDKEEEAPADTELTSLDDVDTEVSEVKESYRNQPLRTSRQYVPASTSRITASAAAPAAPSATVDYEARNKQVALERRLNEFERDAALDQHRQILESKLQVSGLAAPAQKALKEQYWNTPMSEAEVDNAITKKHDEVNQLVEAVVRTKQGFKDLMIEDKLPSDEDSAILDFFRLN